MNSMRQGSSCDGVATWITQRVLLMLFTVTFSRIPSSKGEIRCYCNIPVCVSTGYMCKSSQDVCFSEKSLVGGSNPGKDAVSLQSRHGCVELLQHHHQSRDMCQERARRVNAPKLVCCHEDMCNYVNRLDISTGLHVGSNFNASYAPGGLYQAGSSSSGDSSWYYSSTGADQDLWFKAAVIAVPISGGFILVLLILVAVRLLRQDAKRHRHLIVLRQRRRKSKRPLAVKAVVKSSRDPNLVTTSCVHDVSSLAPTATERCFVSYNASRECRNNFLYSSVVSWGRWSSSAAKPPSLV